MSEVVDTRFCAVCEAEFTINKWQTKKKYCSDKCSANHLKVHGAFKHLYNTGRPPGRPKAKQ